MRFCIIYQTERERETALAIVSPQLATGLDAALLAYEESACPAEHAGHPDRSVL
jgi:hypothetical protein